MFTPTPELLAHVSQELTTLEKNTINDWATQHKNLFTFLDQTIINAMAQSQNIAALIAVQFKGNEAESINGYCTHAGRIQINFGAHLLRKLFDMETALDDTPQDLDAAYTELVFLTAQAIEKALEDMVVKAALEITVLEKQPLPNNWNILYPHVFTLLCRSVIPISNQAGMPVIPLIGIITKGVSSHQMVAQTLITGQQHLLIGSNLIKKQLLDPLTTTLQTPATINSRRNEFEWVVAHEIGHLNDPVIRTYSRGIAPLLNITSFVARILFVGGILNLLIPGMYVFFPSLVSWPIVGYSALTVVVIKMIQILIHRFCEYRADAMSLQYFPNVELKDMENALSSILGNIKHMLFAKLASPNNTLQASNNVACRVLGNLLSLITRVYNSCYKTIVLTYTSHLHPSLPKRLAYMKALMERKKAQ